MREPAFSIPALTTPQMVEVDRLMTEVYGIALIQMMENAGRHLAEMARRMCQGAVTGKRIVVLCGTGNNGGGGMVAARHLHDWGARVLAILVGQPARLKDVPAHQWRILEQLGIGTVSETLPEADLLIDGLLGYGAQGNPRSPIREWIVRANQSGKPILALDTPTGLDTTTGEPGAPCIRATATLTLALPKTGLLSAAAAPFVGELYLADIGVPPELYAAPGLDLNVGPLFAAETIVKVAR